jgi:hypothetical protein
MSEHGSRRVPFEILQIVQQDLERKGYYFFPVEKEHTEGLITEPLVHRIRTQIKKRGFAKVAGRGIITFTGYEEDPREIIDIAEVRSYWRKLDAELPELPALLTYLPELAPAFNGPAQHLMLLGEIDETIHRPELRGYDVYVIGGQRIIEQALQRIRQAGLRYHLSLNQTTRLQDTFMAGVRHRLPLV